MDSSRSPVLRLVPVHDLALAVWDWPGNNPPILFAHATGFHGRIWDQIIRQFPRRRAVAIEARGHGRSAKPAPPYHWPAFGADLSALADALGITAAFGVGHSMGGHAVARAAVLRPETFQSLLLIDPTIFPRAIYGQPPLDGSFTLRRKNMFASAEEMIHRFHKRDPFVRWKPAILRDYCNYGLLPAEGHWTLACPPAVEASIYHNSTAPEADIHAELARLNQPVIVMRAATIRKPGVLDLGASPTDPALASAIPHAREIVLEGVSHYIPMECPDRVTEVLHETGPGRD